MGQITLYNEESASATCVPNLFLDEYMTHANGEYVKVYLYLLRRINQAYRDCSLVALADHFECTEKDVMRALKYWEKLKLCSLEYDGDGALSGIRMITKSAEEPEWEVRSGSVNEFIKAVNPHAESAAENVQSFCEREDVKELLFVSEKYLKRTLSHSDIDTIFFWYDELKLPVDLIEFLIESCVTGGHSSLRYINRVAEDYFARGILDVETARRVQNENSSLYRSVIRAFGIRGRGLAALEQRYLKSWSGKMGFSEEMIVEACSRTIRTIHSPEFKYANSILEKWKREGIYTAEALRHSDEAHKKMQQKGQKKAVGGASFVNFKQRENNYEELQRQLAEKSISR